MAREPIPPSDDASDLGASSAQRGQGVSPRPVKILDPVLANQIAAGEVVERPASAIKELIENALDAGSDEVTIEIREGGRALMRVSDNGHGMTREDALLALERHATSKISAVDDLNAIGTLGFRGEALPSIASVSKLQLTTRVEGAASATRINVEGGRDLKVSGAAGRVGTELIIRDLFFNVPARRKFLKSAQTESGVIHEAVQRIALAYPQVRFLFRKDDHVSLDLPSHHSTQERVRALFGARLADHLCPVAWTGPVRLKGMISHPSFNFSAHRHAYTFINGRFVKDRLFLGAIQRAFGQRLPKGRYPFYLLHLDLHPSLVDVNVHPAKTQVRFVNEEALLDVLTRAFKAAVHEMKFDDEGDSWRARVVDREALRRHESAQVGAADPLNGETGENTGSATRPEARSGVDLQAITAHRERIQAQINRRLRGEGGDQELDLASGLSSNAGADAHQARRSSRAQAPLELSDPSRHEQTRVTQADLEAWRSGVQSDPPSREATERTTGSPPDARAVNAEPSAPPSIIKLADLSPDLTAITPSGTLSGAEALPPLSALSSADARGALRSVGRASEWWIHEAADGVLFTHLPTARAHAALQHPTPTTLTETAELQLSARERDALAERRDALLTLGLDVSEFGGGNARLATAPLHVADEPAESLLSALRALLDAPPELLESVWAQEIAGMPLSAQARARTLRWLGEGGGPSPGLPPCSAPLPYPDLLKRRQHLTPF